MMLEPLCLAATFVQAAVAVDADAAEIYEHREEMRAAPATARETAGLRAPPHSAQK